MQLSFLPLAFTSSSMSRSRPSSAARDSCRHTQRFCWFTELARRQRTEAGKDEQGRATRDDVQRAACDITSRVGENPAPGAVLLRLRLSHPVGPPVRALSAAREAISMQEFHFVCIFVDVNVGSEVKSTAVSPYGRGTLVGDRWMDHATQPSTRTELAPVPRHADDIVILGLAALWALRLCKDRSRYADFASHRIYPLVCRS